MSNKVMIVTDSTCNIPSNMLEGLPISVVPLHIIFNSIDIYLDGINIHPSDFYTKLRTGKSTVTTSQPSPAALAQRYRQYTSEGYDILSIHISAKLSGTLNSAEQARRTLSSANIELVDSQLASMPLGYVVLQAAQAAAQGASLAECKHVAEKARLNSNAIFVVDTLEYLHRGGRIGGASAFFGTALNIKPVLEIKDGGIEVAGRVRTSSKAMDYLLDTLERHLENQTKEIQISAMHAEAHDLAAELLERACQRLGVSNNGLVNDVTPVIGAHVGPGTVAIAYCAVEEIYNLQFAQVSGNIERY